MAEQVALRPQKTCVRKDRDRDNVCVCVCERERERLSAVAFKVLTPETNFGKKNFKHFSIVT